MENLLCLCIFASMFVRSHSVPVVIKGSSPSGDAVIAISSSNPEIEKYFSFNLPAKNDRGFGSGLSATSRIFPDDIFDRTFSIVAPGQAIAGSGRSFVSASNFLPTYFMPLNLDGFGLSNLNSPNWIKRVEDLYDTRLISNGEVRSVTAVNDNGNVYGEVKTVTIDNNGKSHVVKSVLN